MKPCWSMIGILLHNVWSVSIVEVPRGSSPCSITRWAHSLFLWLYRVHLCLQPCDSQKAEDCRVPYLNYKNATTRQKQKSPILTCFSVSASIFHFEFFTCASLNKHTTSGTRSLPDTHVKICIQAWPKHTASCIHSDTSQLVWPVLILREEEDGGGGSDRAEAEQETSHSVCQEQQLTVSRWNDSFLWRLIVSHTSMFLL